MLARIRKTAAVVTATTLALVSTFVGCVASGSNKSIENVQTPAVVSEASRRLVSALPTTEAPFDFDAVIVKGMGSTDAGEVIKFADELAKIPDSQSRYLLAHKFVKCVAYDSDLTLEDKTYLKFLTVMLAARFGEEGSDKSGNARYYLAKNIIRFDPNMGHKFLVLYGEIMCKQNITDYQNETNSTETETTESTSTRHVLQVGEPAQRSASTKAQPTPAVGNTAINEVVTVATNDGNLNCRAMPIKESDITTKFPQGSELHVVIRSTNGWLKVSDSGCWVRETHTAFKKQYNKQVSQEDHVEANIVHSTATNCTDLKAEGYSNIAVWANPDLAKLDRDKDGIACESGKK